MKVIIVATYPDRSCLKWQESVTGGKKLESQLASSNEHHQDWLRSSREESGPVVSHIRDAGREKDKAQHHLHPP